MSYSGLFNSYYKNLPVLVTGGASFIGSHLVELLLEAGAKVVVADDLSSGQLKNLAACKDRIEFFKGDLSDPVFCAKATHQAKVVFHLAADHGGRGYIDTHPVECMNNMVLDHEVFRQSALAGAEKIVFASSACTYPTNLQSSTTDRLLLKESDANFEEAGKAFADGEYGWAKLMGEMQLRAFQKQFGISGIACRIFTAYGERENETHAVIALIGKAVRRMDPFQVWGNGEQTRNFTYVADTVWGMALAGATLSGFQTLNIGSDQHHTILELMDVIFKTLNWNPSSIEKQLDKPVGVLSRASDNTKISELTRWKPSISLEEGVRRTIKWYVETSSSFTSDEFNRRLMERI